jgi:hypothetical protein
MLNVQAINRTPLENGRGGRKQQTSYLSLQNTLH